MVDEQVERAPAVAAGPGGFYRRYGFEETGELDGDEVVIRLAL